MIICSLCLVELVFQERCSRSWWSVTCSLSVGNCWRPSSGRAGAYSARLRVEGCEQRWSQGKHCGHVTATLQPDSFCWLFLFLCGRQRATVAAVGGAGAIGSAARGTFELNKQFWTMRAFCPPWHSPILPHKPREAWKFSQAASKRKKFNNSEAIYENLKHKFKFGRLRPSQK